MGAPSNLCKQRRLHERYTRYVALMAELVETKPSPFEEEIEQPIWDYATLQEYESIMKNIVLEAVPRPIDKSVVDSRWNFKVKHATSGSINMYKAIFVAKGLSQVEGVDYE